MDRTTTNKSMHSTVQEYAHTDYRHIVQVHTWDGLDRTWQSSGADNDPINLHKQADLTLQSLIEKVQMADLPFQWLLDLSIIVETYDRWTYTAVTDHWAVVFVPEVANWAPHGQPIKTYTNKHGAGFRVVHYSGHGMTLPKHKALDITTKES